MKELIAENNYELLLKSDQLRQQQQKRRAFADFQEGEIKFKPTYKYNPGKENQKEGLIVSGTERICNVHVCKKNIFSYQLSKHRQWQLQSEFIASFAC